MPTEFKSPLKIFRVQNEYQEDSEVFNAYIPTGNGLKAEIL